MTCINLLNSIYRAHLSIEQYLSQNNSEAEEEIIKRLRDSTYISRILRRFFPRTKEAEVLRNVLESISNYRRKADESQVVRFGVVCERVYCIPFNFLFASRIQSESGNIRSRCRTLYILRHESVRITVVDIVCRFVSESYLIMASQIVCFLPPRLAYTREKYRTPGFTMSVPRGATFEMHSIHGMS